MRVSRTGVLFAVVGLAGLVLPFVEFRANRIVAGDSIGLSGAAWGSFVMAGLAAVLAFGCMARWMPGWRLLTAAAGLIAVLLSLGTLAAELAAQGSAAARVSPGSGFWLLILAFGLMLADSINRLHAGLALRWLLLVGAVAVIAALMWSGLFDAVSVMREYAGRNDTFLRETRAHLLLAFGSVGLALLAGVPMGIALFCLPRLRGPMLGALNVLQTIPSLAMFGIMIPVFGWIAATVPGAAQAGVSGIGLFPALVALFLYALLPVVSNTVAGLSGVPGNVRDAAFGLGMTQVQVLLQVLLPLAAPVLLAAIRIVLVQNIGLAVIAGLIGGGGFGTFVFQGLNQTAMDLILLGAIPTIALALVAGIALDLLTQSIRPAT